MQNPWKLKRRTNRKRNKLSGKQRPETIIIWTQLISGSQRTLETLQGHESLFQEMNELELEDEDDPNHSPADTERLDPLMDHPLCRGLTATASVSMLRGC